MTGKPVQVYVDGLRPMLRQMGRAPKEVQNEIRDRAQDIAETIAASAGRKAERASPQLARTASTYKAKRDRIPAVRVAAGARKIFSGGGTAAQVWYGAEWGSDITSRWPARARGGRTLYPTLKKEGPAAAEAYLDAVKEVFEWPVR